MVRSLAFVLGSFCIASSLVAGCSSFGTEVVATPDAAPDADAGSSPVVEAGGPDALPDVLPLPDCTSGPNGQNGTFCERFDDDGWPLRWQITGSLGVSNEAAVSAPNALRVLLPREEGTLRSVSRSLLPPLGPIVPARRFEASVSILVPKAGSGDVDLFGFDGDETGGVYLVYSQGTLAFQASTPDAPSEQQAVNATLEKTFHRVTIAIDLDNQRATLHVDGAKHQYDLSPAFVPHALRVGAFYVAAINDPWDLRFDDVTLQSQ